MTESRTAERIHVGLMSGTSLDGVTGAVVRFWRAPTGAVMSELLAWDTVDYSKGERDRLAAALTGATAEEYCRLNFDLGEWLARAAREVIVQAGVATADIASIASHGQTVWHVPGHSTWQFGEAAVIAERLGIPVVSDFRVADVAAGGQGAPLVSIADRLLFADATNWRALQNIGGIGNVTVVPPGGDSRSTRAFDTGPGVVIIDGVTRTLYPDLRFDTGGAIARTGRVLDSVVEQALGGGFYRADPPKSTGRELFTPAYVADFIARCRAAGPCESPDIIATAVALTAASIADQYERFIPEPIAEVVLSGGGAKNDLLREMIARVLAPRRVVRFEERFFDGEAKEAVAFALMGYLFGLGEASNVPTVTGARGPRVLGKLTDPLPRRAVSRVE